MCWSADEMHAHVVACGQVPVRPSLGEGHPRERRYHHSLVGWQLQGLIEKSMSICASSSPGRLPARLKSPNEAWSRYLIPDSLSQSDFAAEVIHPSGTSGGRFNMNHAACCCCCFFCRFTLSFPMFSLSGATFLLVCVAAYHTNQGWNLMCLK